MTAQFVDNNLISPGRKKAALMQAIGGYINTGIVIVQGLLLIPLYLKFLGMHTYGLWLASGGILGMMGLINFGVGSLLIQRVARCYGQRDFQGAGAYFVNGLYLYLGIAVLFGGIALIIAQWLPQILDLDSEFAGLLQDCFRLAALALALAIINECLRSLAQALLRPLLPAVAMALGRILGISITVWLLFRDFGLWAIPIGSLVTEVFVLALNLLGSLFLLNRLKPGFGLDRKIIREYFHTGPALLVARVGTALSHDAEPFLITMGLGPEVTAVYAVIRRAGDIAFRLYSVLVASVMGSFSHLVGSGEQERISRIAESLLILGFFLSVVGFSTYVGANEWFVSLWVGEEYLIDQNVILLIGVGFLFYCNRGLIGRLLYGFGDFNYTSMAIMLEGVCRIVLLLSLMSYVGIVGVPLAFALASFAGIVVLGRRLKQRVSLSLGRSSVVRLVSAACLVFLVGLTFSAQFDGASSWIEFCLFLVLLLASTGVTFMLMNYSQIRETYRKIVY